jgi:hypothetical protein
VSGAVPQLSGGGLLIATRELNLLLFDSSGTYVRTLARRGGGPGEYLQKQILLNTPADTVLAVDGLGRVSVLGGHGVMVRSYQLADTFPRRMQPLPFGAAADGAVYSFLRYSLNPARYTEAGNTSIQLGRPVLLRDSLVVVGFARAGNLRSATSPILAPARAFSLSRTATGFLSRPVAPAATIREPPVALGKGVIFVVRDAEAEIGIYSLAGEMQVRVRVASSATGPPGAATARNWNEAANLGFLTDRAGRLWYELDTQSVADREWLVIDASGALVAIARTPRPVKLLHVADDYVIGVRVTDAHDVVEVYRLISPASPGAPAESGPAPSPVPSPPQRTPASG